MLGELDSATDAFRASLRLSDDADTHFNLAAVFVQQGSVSNALTHYRHAVELDPDFHAARQRLSELESISATDTASTHDSHNAAAED